MPFELGELFMNKYQIERLLGEGGLGRVYLARNMDLGGIPRVIKALRMGHFIDEELQTRFENEAIIGATLNHANIVAVHDFYKPPKVPTYCIVMEYMAGGSLAGWLRKESMLPVDRAVKIIIDICKGLEVAHKEGIVHRDIKPANILLSQDRKMVKIGDWGIAHLPNSPLTYVGQLLGTFFYMSVEQARGDSHIDGRSDLYSVGVMLFKMVTGHFYLDFKSIVKEAQNKWLGSDRRRNARMHFDKIKSDAIRHAIITRKARSPTSYHAYIPPALEAIILKCLAKEPQMRFQSAREMIEALEQVLTTSPPALSPQELMEQARLASQEMNFSTAIKLLKKAKAIAPHTPSVYSQLATLYNLMHQYSKASQILEEGLNINPNSATLLRDLGLTYQRIGQSRKAIWALEQSLTLDREQSQIRRLVKTLHQGLI